MNGQNKNNSSFSLLDQINIDKKKRFISNIKVILLILSTNTLVYLCCNNTTSSKNNIDINPKQVNHSNFTTISIPAISYISENSLDENKLVSIISESNQVIYYDAYFGGETNKDIQINSDNHFYKIEIPNNDSRKLSLTMNQKLLIVPHILPPTLTNMKTIKASQYEINI